MSNIVNLGVAVVPTITASIVAYATDASPIEYGIVGIVLTLGLIPMVKWMMTRMDFAQKQEAELFKTREARADKQLEQITSAVVELRALNNNHREFAAYAVRRLDDIHSLVESIKEKEDE